MLVGHPFIDKGKALWIEVFLGKHLGKWLERNKTFKGREFWEVLGSYFF